VAAIAIIMILEILVDNCTSRVRWQDAMTSAWFVTLVAGAGNIFALSIM